MSISLRSRTGFFTALFGAVILMSALLPTRAVAGIPESIDEALSEFFDLINGLELEEPTLETSFMGTNFTFTLKGVALCEPADPWADPELIPDPPYNSYGCENVSDVDVIIVPTMDEADVTISIEPFFLDFEMDRDYGICIDPFFQTPPCNECSSGSNFVSDGYLLGDGTLTLTLAIDTQNVCPEVTVVPGSVQITFDNTAIELQGDACMAFLMDTFAPFIEPLIENILSMALEEFLTENQGTINDLICLATPAEQRSLGEIKYQYRSEP